MKDAAIFLCAKTPVMAEPWAAAGIECWCVDIQHSIRKPLEVGKINFVWGDARSWRPPEGLNILFVAGFPPCTHTAVSGARDFETKGGNMLRDALETFEACRTVPSGEQVICYRWSSPNSTLLMAGRFTPERWEQFVKQPHPIRDDITVTRIP